MELNKKTIDAIKKLLEIHKKWQLLSKQIKKVYGARTKSTK